MKQQKSPNKGDCVLQIITDFEFIDEQINEDFIRNTSKEEYSKYIKLKVEKATFRKYLQMKESSKTKLKDLTYEKLLMQDYLKSYKFSLEEKKLLYSLRSKCYPAKENFKKMHEGNLNCSLQCGQLETQNHIFENCTKIFSLINIPQTAQMKNIYRDLKKQKN